MTQAPAPVKEIGYASTATGYSWWAYEGETTPELQWPQSVEVYDAMRRTDSQVTSVLEAVTLPVLETAWRIDPAGARAEVVEFVADDLGLPIKGQNPKTPPRTKDRFSWDEHLRLALLMLPFGHSFFEQTYRVDADGARAHLHKLGQRPSRTIHSIDVARDGGLISITQTGMVGDSGPQRPIPVGRLVAYVHKREGGNWLGQSILRPAYKNWLLKERLLRVQAQTIERNGMGVPLYKAAETETDLTPGLGMATSWRSGEAAGSAIPFGADLVLRGVEGTLPDAEPAVRYHDEQIARAVLAHFLNLGTQTGSWALGTTFADFFTLSLQALAQQIARTATQHIVEDLVDINFGEDEPAPRLTFDEIGSRQAATAQALKYLADAGYVHPDEVLEESTRQQFGLPPKDEDTTFAPPVDVSGDGSPNVPDATSDRPGSVAAAGDVGPKGMAAEAAGAVTARFDPNQPRNPENGKWIDTSPGDGLKLYTLANLVNIYGDFVDEVGVVDLEDGSSQFAVVRHDGGDMTLLLNNAGPDHAYAVLADGGPDDMRELADRLEWAATGDVDAVPPSENGLVDWTVEDDGILVGFDPSGDVRIGFPSDDDPDTLVEFDLSGENVAEAWEVIDALREMADAQDAAADEVQAKALIQALAEYSGEVTAAWDPSLHPRDKDGRFRSLVTRIFDAITEHHDSGGKGNPLDAFKGFDREQLRRAAKARGITLTRGEKEDSIARKLLVDVGPGRKSTAKPKAPPKKAAPKKPRAATNLEALDAAPKYSRVLQEAGFSPEKRREYADKLGKLTPAQAHKLGGSKMRASLPEDAPAMSFAERSSITKAAASYMGDGYKPINRSLYDGKPASADVQGEISALDKLFEMSRLDQDVILHRGTRTTDIPDEWETPAFSSTTALDKVARDFAHGEFGGVKTGSAEMEGTPTVLHIRVPEGHPAVQMTDENLAGEVLLPRGTKYRKVADRGVIDGVRHVDVEVVPWERPPSTTGGITTTSLPKSSSDLAPSPKSPTPKTPISSSPLTSRQALNAAPVRFGYDSRGRPKLSGHDEWSSAERAAATQAVYQYTGGQYRAINAHLRGDTNPAFGASGEDVSAQVAAIDKIMQASPLSSDIIVERGIHHPDRIFGDVANGDMTALEWTEQAFVSTTASKKTAIQFANIGGGSTVMRIRVQKGTHAIRLSGSSTESEILLNRGLRMRVISDSGPQKWDMRVIEVEVFEP